MLAELTVGLLVFYILVREVLFYKQTIRLQELLKSRDISDYYEAVSGAKKSKNVNKVMNEEEDNPIAFDDPQFDPKNIDKVFIDGKEIPNWTPID